jgi:hypothetical protein
MRKNVHEQEKQNLCLNLEMISGFGACFCRIYLSMAAQFLLDPGRFVVS